MQQEPQVGRVLKHSESHWVDKILEYRLNYVADWFRQRSIFSSYHLCRNHNLARRAVPWWLHPLRRHFNNQFKDLFKFILITCLKSPDLLSNVYRVCHGEMLPQSIDNQVEKRF